ncbi:hypothetical protein TNCV_187241 [Trichonephila clavipes]|nr:hypothetical protein TNCV_187241 [Trichonephila clavipes]
MSTIILCESQVVFRIGNSTRGRKGCNEAARGCISPEIPINFLIGESNPFPGPRAVSGRRDYRGSCHGTHCLLFRFTPAVDHSKTIKKSVEKEQDETVQS